MNHKPWSFFYTLPSSSIASIHYRTSYNPKTRKTLRNIVRRSLRLEYCISSSLCDNDMSGIFWWLLD